MIKKKERASWGQRFVLRTEDLVELILDSLEGPFQDKSRASPGPDPGDFFTPEIMSQSLGGHGVARLAAGLSHPPLELE